MERFGTSHPRELGVLLGLTVSSPPGTACIMQPTWKRRLRWGALALAGAAVVSIVILWLMFQHIPSWYRPMVIAKEQNQPAKDDFFRTNDTFTSLLENSPGRFEVRLTQDQINSWLAIREELSRLAEVADRTGNVARMLASIPSSLSDPMVVIDRGVLRFAATHRSEGLQTVVSADLALSADQNGINVRLDRIGAGSLPIPVGCLEKELKTLGRHWPTGQRLKDQISDTPLPPLTALPEGATFPNAWLWTTGKMRFRVISIDLQPGALVLTIEPLAGGARRSSNQAPDAVPSKPSR